MQFAEPAFLYLALALVPCFGLVAWWMHALRQRDLKQLGDPVMLARLTQHLSTTKRRWRGWAWGAGLWFLTVALAGPLLGHKLVEVRRQGVDVFIALDLSRSMLAEDVSPNRLQRAQQELAALVDELSGDRVGVVAFAGSAQIACPLTTDRDAAKMFLSYLTPQSVPVPGTNLAEALRAAIRAYPKGSEGFRVLVLLTDGEDHHSSLDEAVNEAKAAGVKVLAIGFGTAAGEPIPQRDDRGQVHGYVKDRQGATVVSKLDEAALQKIASATNGAYWPAHQGVLEAQALTQLIDQMQKRDLSAGQYGSHENRYQAFLLLALLLLFTALWLPERKRAWLLVLPLIFFLAAPASAGVAEDVNAGNQAIKQKRLEQALSHYRDAQIKDPDNPAVAYDLGTALLLSGKFPEAEQAYQRALGKIKNPKYQGQILYNLGNNAFAQEDYAKAVERYRAALKADPKDEDALYNLTQALMLLKHPEMKPKPKPQPQQQPPQQQQQPQASLGQGQQDQKTKSGQGQQQKAGAGKESDKPLDRHGPDDKGEQQAGKDQSQASPDNANRPLKPGEMSKQEAENLLDAVREQEQNAIQDRMRKRQQVQTPGQEDW